MDPESAFRNFVRAWEDALAECPDCNGYGNSLKQTEPSCPKCKGTGVDPASIRVLGPPTEEPQLPEGVYVA